MRAGGRRGQAGERSVEKEEKGVRVRRRREGGKEEKE